MTTDFYTRVTLRAPRNAFQSSRLHTVATLPQPSVGSVGRTRTREIPAPQKTALTTEGSVTSNLTTDWKAKTKQNRAKPPNHLRDISIKEPLNTAQAFFFLRPRFFLQWHTHTCTCAHMCPRADAPKCVMHTHVRAFTCLDSMLLPTLAHVRPVYLRTLSLCYFTFVANLHTVCPQLEFIACFFFSSPITLCKTFRYFRWSINSTFPPWRTPTPHLEPWALLLHLDDPPSAPT